MPFKANAVQGNVIGRFLDVAYTMKTTHVTGFLKQCILDMIPPAVVIGARGSKNGLLAVHPAGKIDTGKDKDRKSERFGKWSYKKAVHIILDSIFVLHHRTLPIYICMIEP